MGYPHPHCRGGGPLVLAAHAGVDVVVDEVDVDLRDPQLGVEGSERRAVLVELVPVGLVGHGGTFGDFEDVRFDVLRDDGPVFEHLAVLRVAVGALEELDR